jgi:hypothetical protein
MEISAINHHTDFWAMDTLGFPIMIAIALISSLTKLNLFATTVAMPQMNTIIQAQHPVCPVASPALPATIPKIALHAIMEPLENLLTLGAFQ